MLRHDERDTIAAMATPSGAGGVGIIRISGPAAVAIVGHLLGRAETALTDRTLVHGVVHDGRGVRLDEVLAVVMRGPRSFTGEDVGEIHGHGGTVNMARLLRAVVEAGARHAEAGEFTRRAFAHGKLDLAQAEALCDVISASSERAWRLAQAQLAGRLGAHVAEYRQRATTLLAELEACIDFPEEGETYLDEHALGSVASALAGELEALAATFTLGRALREGITVAITGPVNAGKSSLFNALLGEERALVDAGPGTTRDFVESRVVWDGVAVLLIDTAGERATAETQVERQGIALGRRRAAQADLRVIVHAADQPGLASVLDAQASQQRALAVITKADLLSEPHDGVLCTSSLSGDGIASLRAAIVACVCGVVAEADDGEVVTSERQRDLLQAGAQALRRMAEGVDARRPMEVLALEVRDAANALAALVGEQVSEDVLDALFSRFCIGK